MNREQFDKTRHEFEQLRTEEKAVFLVEAVASTLARGVEQVGKVVVEEIDRVFKKRQEAPSSSETKTDPFNGNPPQPETPPM